MQSTDFSYWDHSRLRQPVDVLIVGAGITGLSCALHLTKVRPDLRVRVVDQHRFTRLASTRNAGFLCFGSLTEIVDDMRQYGDSTALALVENRFRGMERIRNTFGIEELEYAHTGGFELIDQKKFSAGDYENKMKKLNSLLSGISSEPVFSILSESDHEFPFHPDFVIVQNPHEGQLNPASLVRALYAQLPRDRVEFLEGVTVNGYEWNRDSFDVSTSAGKWAAQNIILATNALANQLLDLHEKIRPARNLVLVSQAFQPGFRGVFHAEEGFLYFRNVGPDRILIGGGRHWDIENEFISELGTNEKIMVGLKNYLQEVIFPSRKIPEIEYSWSGIMGMAPGKTPVVRRIEKGLYVAAGFSGMGVALGMQGGIEIADVCLEEMS